MAKTKKFATLLLITIGLTMYGCDDGVYGEENNSVPALERSDVQAAQTQEEPSQIPDTANNPGSTNILIAYFSHTGNTQALAQYIHEITGGDLFEIVTVNPYPTDYNECLDVARRELEDDYRPVLAAQVEDMEKYDIVFIGHPIWHGHTPMAIRSFLEAYDFSGKIILPFCTSGSSGNSQAMATIRDMCPNSAVLDGLSITRATLPDARNLAEAWLDGMNIGNTPAWTDGMNADNAAVQDSIINIQIGDTVLTATLVDNSSTEELKELLASGSVSIDMRDYGNMEKVGGLGVNLPTNDERISTEPGDLILYQGNSFVIYYEPHSWSFTRLGRINGITQTELKEVLGSGNVTVILSLNQD